MGENREQSRKLEVVEQLYTEYKEVEKWAVIVGISEYKHKSWNLRYAHRDAEELHKLLLTENGGNFKKDNIRLLTNKEATKKNIEDALRDFLIKPDKDDLVLLYFACHGSPDFRRPNNELYFLAHDTNPKKIAATGLRMSEIDEILKQNILIADKVIILADTCHSGGVGGSIGKRSIGQRSVSDNSEQVNRYLNNLGTAKSGIVLLTSAQTGELSNEGKQWGGGHGIFTHFVLEGMRGNADNDGNGIVTVGELFEYVREKVKEATDNQQHPSIGTSLFDPNLPVAITQIKEVSPHRNDEDNLNGLQDNTTNTGETTSTNFILKVTSIFLGIVITFLVILDNIKPPQVIPEKNKSKLIENNSKRIKDITGCSTSKNQVRNLDNQILTMVVKNNPTFIVPIKDLNIVEVSSTFLYLQPVAKESLRKAIEERGQSLRINSAYRSITQQQILYNHSRNGRCGVALVARPGRSKHQSGLAIDIKDHVGWRPYLEKYGWRWFGLADPVHFDYVGNGRKDISFLPALGFQQLWNLANPEDQIEVNGLWGAEMELRFNNSPVSGFDVQINIFD